MGHGRCFYNVTYDEIVGPFYVKYPNETIFRWGTDQDGYRAVRYNYRGQRQIHVPGHDLLPLTVEREQLVRNF